MKIERPTHYPECATCPVVDEKIGEVCARGIQHLPGYKSTVTRVQKVFCGGMDHGRVMMRIPYLLIHSSDKDFPEEGADGRLGYSAGSHLYRNVRCPHFNGRHVPTFIAEMFQRRHREALQETAA